MGLQCPPWTVDRREVYSVHPLSRPGMNMAQPLTATQQKALEAIQRHVRSHGVAPSLRQLAADLGVASHTAASKLVKALAKAGHVTMQRQRGGLQLAAHGRADESPLKLPVLGMVAAGAPLEAGERDREVPIDPRVFSSPIPDYLLEVIGDSMIDAGIESGDLIAVRAVDTADHGQTVIARLNGGLTVKRLRRSADNTVLESRNPDYAPIIPGPGDEFEVIGIYCGLIRPA